MQRLELRTFRLGEKRGPFMDSRKYRGHPRSRASGGWEERRQTEGGFVDPGEELDCFQVWRNWEILSRRVT